LSSHSEPPTENKLPSQPSADDLLSPIVKRQRKQIQAADAAQNQVLRHYLDTMRCREVERLAEK
jgi:hypothetical protein